jgi:hypothetical protein
LRRHGIADRLIELMAGDLVRAMVEFRPLSSVVS